jgi:DNA ligase (NAD+)
MQSDFLRRQRLYYFVSKTALNIDGIGPKIIDALLDEKLIKTADDLFTLKKEDFLKLPGFKEKSAQNAVAAIDQVRQVSFARLLVGLSIDQVGEETARLLVKYFKTPTDLLTANAAALEAIHGIGEVVARAVLDWQNNKEEQALFKRLLSHLEVSSEPTAVSGGKLTGQSFVFTGTLADLARSEAEEMVRQAGGSVVSSVSRKTSYVVVGEDPGSKADQAEKLGVPVLDKTAFLTLIAS